jgi:hypothetical protein
MDALATINGWVVAAVRAIHASEMSFWIKDQSFWVWPLLESLHFTGMVMLIGAIGTFDLRVLGVAKSIPPSALHRLVPFGVAGYLLNLATGIVFFIGYPDQYTFNSAFHFKLGFMALAGMNMILFYRLAYGELREVPAGADAPSRAKIFTAVSLAAWISVIVCGRLLTFFRPISFVAAGT